MVKLVVDKILVELRQCCHHALVRDEAASCAVEGTRAVNVEEVVVAVLVGFPVLVYDMSLLTIDKVIELYDAVFRDCAVDLIDVTILDSHVIALVEGVLVYVCFGGDFEIVTLMDRDVKDRLSVLRGVQQLAIRFGQRKIQSGQTRQGVGVEYFYLVLHRFKNDVSPTVRGLNEIVVLQLTERLADDVVGAVIDVLELVHVTQDVWEVEVVVVVVLTVNGVYEVVVDVGGDGDVLYRDAVDVFEGAYHAGVLVHHNLDVFVTQRDHLPLGVQPCGEMLGGIVGVVEDAVLVDPSEVVLDTVVLLGFCEGDGRIVLVEGDLHDFVGTV